MKFVIKDDVWNVESSGFASSRRYLSYDRKMSSDQRRNVHDQETISGIVSKLPKAEAVQSELEAERLGQGSDTKELNNVDIHHKVRMDQLHR